MQLILSKCTVCLDNGKTILKNVDLVAIDFTVDITIHNTEIFTFVLLICSRLCFIVSEVIYKNYLKVKTKLMTSESSKEVKSIMPILSCNLNFKFISDTERFCAESHTVYNVYRSLRDCGRKEKQNNKDGRQFVFSGRNTAAVKANVEFMKFKRVKYDESLHI